MSQYLIAAPVKDLFTRPDQFKAIFNGKIYIGAADQDPLNPTHQIPIYVVNEDGSHTQVAQPIPINSGGYAVYNGSPSKFVCDAPYSIVVLDNNGAEQWRAPDIRAIDPAAVSHNDTLDRDEADAHPASSITDSTKSQPVQTTLDGLQTALDTKADATDVEAKDDLVQGISRSAKFVADLNTLIPATARQSAIRKTSTGKYIVHQQLNGAIWRETILGNSGEVVPGVNSPWKITEESIFRVAGYKTIKDAVQGGTWSVFNSGSDIYVGHQVAQSNSAGNTLTWTFSGSGLIELGFTGDTDGGIVNVTIDGGAAIQVDTYSATANNYRQWARLGVVDSGSHTIVVTTTANKNPASSAAQANITSLRITGDSVAPYSQLYQAKPWETGVLVRAYEEVRGPNGQYYYTVAGGTTGSTPPTHTTGTASDGAVSWVFMAKTSFGSESQRISASGSEREYKYEIQPVGQAGYEDVGGNLHGNEFNTTLDVLIDGQSVSVGAVWQVGSVIELNQTVTAYYGVYASKTDVFATNHIHQFVNGQVKTYYKHTALVAVDVRKSYACMWPFLAYDGPNSRKGFRYAGSPRNELDIKDYEGVVSTNPIGLKKDFVMYATGRGLIAAGAPGVPVAGDGNLGVTIAMSYSPSSVGDFADSALYAGIAPNLGGGSYTGFSSLLSKMYVQDIDAAKRYEIGETREHGANYMIVLDSNAVTF